MMQEKGGVRTNKRSGQTLLDETFDHEQNIIDTQQPHSVRFPDVGEVENVFCSVLVQKL